MASHNSILRNRRNIKVIAGFMWAPDCFPHGEWISNSSVAAIATPVSTMRTNGLAIQ